MSSSSSELRLNCSIPLTRIENDPALEHHLAPASIVEGEVSGSGGESIENVGFPKPDEVKEGGDDPVPVADMYTPAFRDWIQKQNPRLKNHESRLNDHEVRLDNRERQIIAREERFERFVRAYEQQVLASESRVRVLEQRLTSLYQQFNNCKGPIIEEIAYCKKLSSSAVRRSRSAHRNADNALDQVDRLDRLLGTFPLFFSLPVLSPFMLIHVFYCSFVSFSRCRFPWPRKC